MRIGSLQRFSLIDYPGRICVVVFTQGCNFRCHYCHNPELVVEELFQEPLSEKAVFSFLEKRKGMLEAVTITGGEPTLQRDLIGFLEKTRQLGYLVKLDTNGSRPEMVKRVIESKLIDYIAMDVKAPEGKYREVANSYVNTDKIKQSIKLIIDSKLNYEFRTTVVRSQLNERDIMEIGEMIQNAKRYVLQKFVPSKTLDRGFRSLATYSAEEFEHLRESLKSYVVECSVR